MLALIAAQGASGSNGGGVVADPCSERNSGSFSVYSCSHGLSYGWELMREYLESRD